MKINKKGYTLIELLSIIVVIGIVLTISIVGVNGYMENSKEKSMAISIKNLKESAKIYAKEHYNSKDWVDYYDASIERTCVSKSQITSMGLIDQKSAENIDIEYIILKRNKENMNIVFDNTLNKDFIANIEETQNGSLEETSEPQEQDFLDYELCKNIAIDNPTPVENLIYTDAIETTFKITPEIIENDENGRKITSVICELSSKNDSSLNKTVEFNNEDEIKKVIKNNNNITCSFNKLRHSNATNQKNKYSVILKLKYEGKENYYTGSTKFLSLKKLKSPSILLNGNKEEENKYVKNTTVNIEYYEDNIHSFATVTKTNNLTTDVVGTNNFEFNLDQNKVIEATISDGTNSVTSNNEVKFIDNRDYSCEIIPTYNSDYSAADLKVNVFDKNEPSVNIIPNILGYSWSGEKYSTLKNITNNPVSSKTVYVSSNYTITLKNRRGEDFSCSVVPDELVVKAPEIKIEILKSSTNEIIDGNNWYNYDIYAKITTDSNAVISYCVTENINDTCIPEKTNVNAIPIESTSDSAKKIIAYATNKISHVESSSVTDYLKVDKTKPSVPSSKIYNSSGTDVTTSFDPIGSNTWKNYSITWKDWNSVDTLINGAASGINHYEYKRVASNATSCSGDKTDNLNQAGYSYSNVEIHACIRAVDNAGNISDWSNIYHIKIDTNKPSVPSSKIYNASGTNITTTFNPINSNTWKNYKVTWKDWNSIDSKVNNIASGINQYEFKHANGATSCSGSRSGILKSTGYTYSNVEYHVCIRSVDNAGNVSDWSPVYHIKIDTMPPNTFIVDLTETNKLSFVSSIKKYTDPELTNANQDYYSTHKSGRGSLVYTSDSCKDYNPSTGKYDISIPTNKQYISWALGDRSDLDTLNDPYGDTDYNINGNGDPFKGYRTTLRDWNYVRYDKYYEYNSPKNNMLIGGRNEHYIYYSRYCIDRAGNRSKYYMNQILIVN